MRKTALLLAIPMVGLCIILCGFLYDVLFAGIPYQDPTPALQVEWERHRAIAEEMYTLGGIVFLGGVLIAPLLWLWVRRREY